MHVQHYSSYNAGKFPFATRKFFQGYLSNARKMVAWRERGREKNGCACHADEKDLRQFCNSSITQWYNRWKRRTVHPNLRIDYFHTIDAKEKAYWLGFLYADGFITEQHGSIEIRLELSKDDENSVDRFCRDLGLNNDKKEYRRHRKIEKECVEIRFACRKMSDDLIRHGLRFRKSKIIEYPKLSSRDLELAFLLGYYDGDGKHNTTEISSGNRRFLEQVANRFDLPSKIRLQTGEKEIYGRKIKGTVCRMYLGAQLFNEMMKNYQNSMPRKRWFPCNPKEKARRRSRQEDSRRHQ
jgi:hypothetical protein